MPSASKKTTGLELTTAEAALKALGLTAGQVTRSHNESLPVGTVISAVPEPGVLVQRGSAINMIVSKGRTPIDVPSLKGMTEKSAVKLLKDAGFRVTTTKDESEAKSGTVIAQKPSAGTALPPGQTITVTVSAGVSLVTVPNAERYDRGSMDSSQDIPGLRAAFSNLGLKLQIRSHSFPWAFEQGGSDEEGSFFGQSPAPGTKARRGTVITVHQLTYPPVN